MRKIIDDNPKLTVESSQFKVPIIGLILTLIIPLVITLILKWIYNFSNTFERYLIPLLEIFVTAFFSYILWQTSVKSNKLAETINRTTNEKEESLEREKVKENALIVYYDLTLGIQDLMKLYVSRIDNNKSPNPKRLFFSDQWIKNIALIRYSFSSSELNKLYTLYGDLLILKNLLEINTDRSKFSVSTFEERMKAKSCMLSLDEEIKKLFNKIMNKDMIESVNCITDDLFDIKNALNNDYYKLLQKVYSLTEDKYTI